MNDFWFWTLVIGFAILGCVFLNIILNIIDRKRRWAKCGMCGWEGPIDDPFDTCPECNYFNWE